MDERVADGDLGLAVHRRGQFCGAGDQRLITDSKGGIVPVERHGEDNTAHTVTMSNDAAGTTSADVFTVTQNTNCMDASDPNSTNAAVCGASESSSPTVTFPPVAPITTQQRRTMGPSC